MDVLWDGIGGFVEGSLGHWDASQSPTLILTGVGNSFQLNSSVPWIIIREIIKSIQYSPADSLLAWHNAPECKLIFIATSSDNNTPAPIADRGEKKRKWGKNSSIIKFNMFLPGASERSSRRISVSAPGITTLFASPSLPDLALSIFIRASGGIYGARVHQRLGRQ